MKTLRLTDHREFNHLPEWAVQADPDKMQVTILDITHPARWGVCPCCDGKGKYVNPSIDSHGISPEEFHEDPDFMEDYFRGTYDVTCMTCNGRTTVLVPSTAEGQKALQEVMQEDADHRAEVDAERRMGA